MGVYFSSKHTQLNRNYLLFIIIDKITFDDKTSDKCVFISIATITKKPTNY